MLAVLEKIRSAFPWLRHVFADAGYAGKKLEDALTALGQWTLEIVRRSEFAKGFELLQCRWVVERTIAQPPSRQGLRSLDRKRHGLGLDRQRQTLVPTIGTDVKPSRIMSQTPIW